MNSISDNNKYPNFCELAAQNLETFATFKSDPVYTQILEHVTYEEGLEYINQFKNNKHIIDNIDKFQINDKLGSSKQYFYSDFNKTFSPTTLRYIKILNDLSQLDLNNKHIVEIGAGYGGQYTIIRQIFQPKKYTFIDLGQVLALIKKYITTLNLNDIEIDFINCNDLCTDIKSDIVISNYAFSECSIDTQELYIKKILQHTKNCYMIYNNLYGYTHHQLIEKMLPIKVKINQEIPKTHPNNVLLTW
jgi:putative sugar O-methyltransferase